jgi:hypothetical protein
MLERIDIFGEPLQFHFKKREINSINIRRYFNNYNSNFNFIICLVSGKDIIYKQRPRSFYKIAFEKVYKRRFSHVFRRIIYELLSGKILLYSSRFRYIQVETAISYLSISWKICDSKINKDCAPEEESWNYITKRQNNFSFNLLQVQTILNNFTNRSNIL